MISTIAGDGTSGYSGNGGPATSAQLYHPTGMAFDSEGDLFIADPGNNVIREVTPDGIISTAAAMLSNPEGVAVNAAGDLFIADTVNDVIREVTPDGNISTVAGTGSFGDSGDGGLATAATLRYPEGVAVDANGDLFIADSGNNVIREVTPNGIIHTVAGTGSSGYSGDGGLATAAKLYGPSSVAVDANGDLFIADGGNNVIREVTPNGIIHTVAGTGSSGYTGDGGPATAAKLSSPFGVTVDATGDLFIADTYNYVIREVTPDGIIHTVAGTGSYGYSGDGGLATAATLRNPFGVAVNAAGDLFIADLNSNAIRKVSAGLSFTVQVAGPAVGFVVTSTPGSVIAGTTESITVMAVDSNGNQATGYTGTVHFTSSDGQAVLPADSSLTKGTGTFNFTLKTAGTQSVTVNDTGNPDHSGTESGITVTPAAATQLVVAGAAGGTADTAETLTVTAEDPYGNIDPSYTGTVHFSSSDVQAVLPADSSLTKGTGTFNFTLKSAGMQSITATDTATGTITGTETGVAVTPTGATHFTVSSLSGDAAGTVLSGHRHGAGPLRQHRSQLHRHGPLHQQRRPGRPPRRLLPDQRHRHVQHHARDRRRPVGDGE